MLKKYLLPLIMIISIIGCKKESDYISNIFPGITGSGNEATWVVYSHTFTDVPFITSYVATITPPTTFAKYDSTYILARQKEVTVYSYKFYDTGEVGLIGKSAQNENIWIKQSNLKWETKEDVMYVYKNVGGSWINIFIGLIDQEKLTFKYRKSYFGDTSAEKDRFVMDVIYSMFK